MDDKVNYSIDKGLIFMLAGLAKISQKEVWVSLSEMTQECIGRIKKKKSQTESWKWFEFPNTDINMKVKVYHSAGRTMTYGSKKGSYVPAQYDANIKLDRNGQDNFTSEQVSEYLIEEILLGEDTKALHE